MLQPWPTSASSSMLGCRGDVLASLSKHWSDLEQIDPFDDITALSCALKKLCIAGDAKGGGGQTVFCAPDGFCMTLGIFNGDILWSQDRLGLDAASSSVR